MLVATFSARLAAEPESAFLKDLKAQNKDHLARELVLPKEKKPPTLTREWEDKITKKQWELSEGPLKVHVGLTTGGPPDGMLFQSPVVTLSVEGKEVIKSEGSESFPDNPIFTVQIAEMDPSNPYKEVLFSTYTGGAHCCSDTRILTSSEDGKSWKEIELGMFDGGPMEAKDADGDGRYELVTRDNAFLYTFGCYACSTAPILVMQIEQGEVVDASTKPSFRNRHLSSLRFMLEGAHDENRNAFLAGYVGQKIRLGEGAQAWQLMLKHYDKNEVWGLESCAVKEDDKGQCPKGKTIKLTYPQALEKFLIEAGYKVEK